LKFSKKTNNPLYPTKEKLTFLKTFCLKKKQLSKKHTPQFYIQLVYKATLSFTLRIQIVNGSLFRKIYFYFKVKSYVKQLFSGDASNMKKLPSNVAYLSLIEEISVLKCGLYIATVHKTGGFYTIFSAHEVHAVVVVPWQMETVTDHSIGHDSFHRDNGFSLPGKVSEFLYCGALAPSSACRAKHIPKGERKEVVVHFVKMMLLCLVSSLWI
jgi:hypothetical protein